MIYLNVTLKLETSKGCFLDLKNHSTSNKIAIEANVLIVPDGINGTLTKLLLNIPLKYANASVMVSARKNIHPITTSRKVSAIWRHSRMLGSILPEATVSVNRLFLPKRMSGMKSKAW